MQPNEPLTAVDPPVQPKPPFTLKPKPAADIPLQDRMLIFLMRHVARFGDSVASATAHDLLSEFMAEFHPPVEVPLEPVFDPATGKHDPARLPGSVEASALPGGIFPEPAEVPADLRRGLGLIDPPLANPTL